MIIVTPPSFKIHTFETFSGKTKTKLLLSQIPQKLRAFGVRMVQLWNVLPLANMAHIRFRPSAICVLILLLILAMLPGFFPVSSGLPPSTKTIIFKFQLDQDIEQALKPVKADAASSLNIVILSRSSVFVID